jgi:hypothetical protein
MNTYRLRPFPRHLLAKDAWEDDMPTDWNLGLWHESRDDWGHGLVVLLHNQAVTTLRFMTWRDGRRVTQDVHVDSAEVFVSTGHFSLYPEHPDYHQDGKLAPRRLEAWPSEHTEEPSVPLHPTLPPDLSLATPGEIVQVATATHVLPPPPPADPVAAAKAEVGECECLTHSDPDADVHAEQSPPPLRLRIIVSYVYAENLSDAPLFPRWMLFRPRQRTLFLTLPMMKAWTLCRMETTLKTSGQTLTRFPPSAQLLVCTTLLRSEWHGAISTVVTIVHPWKGSSLLCGFTV